MAVDRIKEIGRLDAPGAAQRIQKSSKTEWTKAMDNVSERTEAQKRTEKPPETNRTPVTTTVEGNLEVSKSVNNDILSISTEGKMASGYLQALKGSFEARNTQSMNMTPDEILTAYAGIYNEFMGAVEQSFTGRELIDNVSSLDKAYSDIQAEYRTDISDDGNAPRGNISIINDDLEAGRETDKTEREARDMLTRYLETGDLNSAIANTFVQLNSKTSGAVSYAQLLQLASSMGVAKTNDEV